MIDSTSSINDLMISKKICVKSLRVFTAAFTFLFLLNTVSAQYEIKGYYLKNPELVKGHVDSCAQFWFSSYDEEHGGFYQNVSRNGSVDDNSNDKTMLGQTRTAYGMVKAFMLTGDTTYLNFARGALDFMYEHAWDSTNGGWFNELDREGNLRVGGQHNNDKWSFMQHYALLGITAMAEATRSEKDFQMFLAGREAVDNNLYDDREGLRGYYEDANVDWSNPNGKGFTPSMDGITTHLLSSYLLTKEDKHKEKLLDVADNVVKFMLPAMDYFSYGFPEQYNSNWEPNISNTFVFTGHFLKTAWCLTRAYLIEQKQEYIDFSTTSIKEVLDKGYDHTNGGCYSNYNGLNHTRHNSNKEWWQLEQAFTSGIVNYYITSNEDALQMADETLDFYMSNFVDREYGEVYTSTSSTGKNPNTTKASYWKAGYHSIELGYYVYLYGNLYIHNKPVTLYYKFDETNEERTIPLYPLAIEDDRLSIKEITLEGTEYSNFLSSERILSIPQNTGGVFAVTFENSKTTSVDKDNYLPKDFVLHQNYPNPFNPSTEISYELNTNGIVLFDVFNVNGEKIKTIEKGYKPAGRYVIGWNGINDNGSSVPSGVYFFHLRFNNKHQVIKAVLLK